MSRRVVPVLAAGISAMVALAGAPVAGAATSPFGCSAAAVQATIGSSPVSAAVTGGNPCVGGSAQSAGATAAGVLVAGLSASFTHLQHPGEAPGAGALAAATAVTVTGAGNTVVIDGAQAASSLACVAGTLRTTGSSEVSAVTVNGAAVALSTPSEATRIALGKGGSYVLLNQATTTSTSVTREAAIVHLVGVGDVSVAHTALTAPAQPCAKAGGSPAAVLPCDPGAVYDPVSNRCRITTGTRRPIVVSTPFGAPTGGAVDTVAQARARFPTAACLRGRGAAYVIVGDSSLGGVITGTSGADRILALGSSFTIHGAGGADCIAAAGGNMTITDGNGRVRIFGGGGSDTIRLGNGADRLILGPGNKTVTVGNGADRIITGIGTVTLHAGNGADFIRLGGGIAHVRVGNGNDRIVGAPGVNSVSAGNGRDVFVGAPGINLLTFGTGSDSIAGGPGFDRITARGTGAEVSCGAGGDAVSVTPPAVAYARRHGCRIVTGNA